LGQRAFDERLRLQVALRAGSGGGKVGDGQVGDVMVQRRTVSVEERAEPGVGSR